MVVGSWIGDYRVERTDRLYHKDLGLDPFTSMVEFVHKDDMKDFQKPNNAIVYYKGRFYISPCTEFFDMTIEKILRGQIGYETFETAFVALKILRK